RDGSVSPTRPGERVNRPIATAAAPGSPTPGHPRILSRGAAGIGPALRAMPGPPAHADGAAVFRPLCRIAEDKGTNHAMPDSVHAPEHLERSRPCAPDTGRDPSPRAATAGAFPERRP